MHSKIRDKIRGIGLPLPKSRGALLMELAHEMKELKEELEDSGFLLFYLNVLNFEKSSHIEKGVSEFFLHASFFSMC